MAATIPGLQVHPRRWPATRCVFLLPPALSARGSNELRRACDDGWHYLHVGAVCIARCVALCSPVYVSLLFCCWRLHCCSLSGISVRVLAVLRLHVLQTRRISSFCAADTAILTVFRGSILSVKYCCRSGVSGFSDRLISGRI